MRSLLGFPPWKPTEEAPGRPSCDARSRQQGRTPGFSFIGGDAWPQLLQRRGLLPPERRRQGSKDQPPRGEERSALHNSCPPVALPSPHRTPPEAPPPPPPPPPPPTTTPAPDATVASSVPDRLRGATRGVTPYRVAWTDNARAAEWCSESSFEVRQG